MEQQGLEVVEDEASHADVIDDVIVSYKPFYLHQLR